MSFPPHVPTTCPAHLILTLITFTTFNAKYTSFCNFLQPPVPSANSVPHVALSTQLLPNLTLFSFNFHFEYPIMLVYGTILLPLTIHTANYYVCI